MKKLSTCLLLLLLLLLSTCGFNLTGGLTTFQKKTSIFSKKKNNLSHLRVLLDKGGALTTSQKQVSKLKIKTISTCGFCLTGGLRPLGLLWTNFQKFSDKF
jgi:outer membrane lipopolysaccharide assembly protein LptE/RlpB